MAVSAAAWRSSASAPPAAGLTSIRLSSREKAESYQIHRPASAVPFVAICSRLSRPAGSGPWSRSRNWSQPRSTRSVASYMASFTAVNLRLSASSGHTFLP